MKHVLLLCCCCFYASLFAQTATTDTRSKGESYVFGSFQLGLPFTAQLGLEVILPSELSLGAFLSVSSRDSPNKPHDYDVVNFLGSDNNRVSEGLALGILTIGKTWWVSDNSNARFNLKAGPLLGVFSTPENFVKGGVLFSNYTYDRNEYFTAGIAVQPSLLFAVGRVIGINLGGMALINKYRSIYGVTFGINVGKLRSK